MAFEAPPQKKKNGYVWLGSMGLHRPGCVSMFYGPIRDPMGFIIIFHHTISGILCFGFVSNHLKQILRISMVWVYPHPQKNQPLKGFKPPKCQSENPSENPSEAKRVFQPIFVRWAANLILKNVFDSIDEKEFGVVKWDPFFFVGGLTNLMQSYGNVDGFPESVCFGLILLMRTRNLDVNSLKLPDFWSDSFYKKSYCKITSVTITL